MDKAAEEKLWAEFGQSCAELEIVTRRHNEIKQRVADMLAKQPKKEEPKAE